jgi:hypothetical protein
MAQCRADGAADGNEKEVKHGSLLPPADLRVNRGLLGQPA